MTRPGTWTYYTVDTVSHSEIDDDSSHIWQCQDSTYDEGAPSGTLTPSAGLAHHRQDLQQQRLHSNAWHSPHHQLPGL